MLNSIIEASLNNRLFVLMAIALVAGLGVYSALNLPIDAVPDLTNVQVQVITEAPALSPMEAWIGLAQATDSPTADQGWQWYDGSTGYGVPVTIGAVPWDPGEPNDGGGAEANRENCGLLLAPARSSHVDDRGCGDHLPYVCERSWSW